MSSQQQQRQLSVRIRKVLSQQHDQHEQNRIILEEICPILSEIDEYFSPKINHYHEKYKSFHTRPTQQQIQMDTKTIERMKKKIEDLIKIFNTFIQKLQYYRHLHKIKTRDEHGAFVKCTTILQKHTIKMEKYLKKIQKIIKRLEPIQLPKTPPKLKRSTPLKKKSSPKGYTTPPSGMNTPSPKGSTTPPSSGMNTPSPNHSPLSKKIYYRSIYNPHGLSRSQSQQVQ